MIGVMSAKEAFKKSSMNTDQKLSDFLSRVKDSIGDAIGRGFFSAELIVPKAYYDQKTLKFVFNELEVLGYSVTERDTPKFTLVKISWEELQ